MSSLPLNAISNSAVLAKQVGLSVIASPSVRGNKMRKYNHYTDDAWIICSQLLKNHYQSIVYVNTSGSPSTLAGTYLASEIQWAIVVIIFVTDTLYLSSHTLTAYILAKHSHVRGTCDNPNICSGWGRATEITLIYVHQNTVDSVDSCFWRVQIILCHLLFSISVCMNCTLLSSGPKLDNLLRHSQAHVNCCLSYQGGRENTDAQNHELQ